MPQVPTYDPAIALTGTEVWHAVQNTLSVKMTPNDIKAFINYSLPVADTGILGGILDGTDISIDAFGNVSINDNSHDHDWENINATPTTLLGYGIIDAFPAHTHPWSEVTARPTILAGYGIEDAAPLSHVGGNIHIDWSVTGAEQIHANRYTDTTYSSTDFVDLISTQTAAGAKTWSNWATFNSSLTVAGNIWKTDDTGLLRLGGGNDIGSGAVIELHGATGPNPEDIYIYSGGGFAQLQYDNSASLWDFKNNTGIFDSSTAGGPGSGIKISDFEVFPFSNTSSKDPTIRTTELNGTTVLRVLGNGTGGAQFEFFGVDFFTDTNWENFKITSGNTYLLQTQAAGTGILRPMEIRTGGNIGQLYLDTDGNIGVNTTSPDAVVTIMADSASPTSTANMGMFRYQDTISGVSLNCKKARGSLTLPTATIAGDRLIQINAFGYGDTGFSLSSTAYLRMYSDATFTDISNPTYITFGTSPIDSIAAAERMRIDSDGNVGIGTTAPTSRLEVVSDNASASANWLRYGNDIFGAVINFKKTRGTKAVPTATLANDELMKLAAFGYGDTKLGKNVADIKALAEETFTDLSQAAYLQFSTNPVGSVVNSVERMRIDSAGNVGIGVIPTAWWSSSNVLQVGYGSLVNYGAENTQVGDNIYYDGTDTLTIVDGYSARITLGVKFSVQATPSSNLAGAIITSELRDLIVADYSTGNVGIGMAVPDSALHVTNGSNTNLEVSSAANSLYAGIFDSVGVLSINRNPVSGVFKDTLKTAATIKLRSEPTLSYISFETINVVNTDPSERMRIDASGNVGIGTDTPLAPLHVANVTGNAIVTIQSSDIGKSILRLGKASNAAAHNITMDSSAVAMSFTMNSSEYMRLTQTGLGIGIDNPTTPLHVYGIAAFDGASTSSIYNRVAGVLKGLQTVDVNNYILESRVVGFRLRANNVAGYIRFDTGTSNLERMRIDSDGNVGIGNTPSGTYKLEVTGDIGASNLSGTNTGDDSVFVAKTVDQIVNGTITLQDDDELVIALAASKKYYFELFLLYSTGSVPDILVKWAVPTGTTMKWARLTDAYLITQTESQTEVLNGVGIAFTNAIKIGGYIKTSTTAGTLQFQWTQSIPEFSDTTVEEGSNIRLWEI